MKIGGRNVAIILGALIILVSAGVWVYQDSISKVDEMSVRIYADPMAENILASIELEDFASFTRNMDAAMKAAYTPEELAKLHSLLQGKVGDYGSKTFVKAERSGDFIITYYKASYSNEPAGVTVRVVFSVNTGGPALVSGLWFSSPKLAF